MLDESERARVLDELRRMVWSYSHSEEGGWLRDFDWSSVPVTFKDLKNGVCGMYSFGKIVLLTSGEMRPIFPIYVHELRHRWQWRKSPLRYLIGKVVRPLIENDADREERKAEQWLNECSK